MKKIRSLIVMLLAMVVITSTVAMPAQASTDVPYKVSAALTMCVDDNGRAIIIDQSAGQMYLFKRDCKSHKWQLKKVFRCIVGQKLCKSRHYFLHRSPDIDLTAWGTETERWSYGMYIDCYERPYTNMIHSYTDHYNGKTWSTKKTAKWNTEGIAVCESNAFYIWKHYGDGTAVMAV